MTINKQWDQLTKKVKVTLYSSNVRYSLELKSVRIVSSVSNKRVCHQVNTVKNETDKGSLCINLVMPVMETFPKGKILQALKLQHTDFTKDHIKVSPYLGGFYPCKRSMAKN